MINSNSVCFWVLIPQPCQGRYATKINSRHWSVAITPEEIVADRSATVPVGLGPRTGALCAGWVHCAIHLWASDLFGEDDNFLGYGCRDSWGSGTPFLSAHSPCMLQWDCGYLTLQRKSRLHFLAFLEWLLQVRWKLTSFFMFALLTSRLPRHSSLKQKLRCWSHHSTLSTSSCARLPLWEQDSFLSQSDKILI